MKDNHCNCFQELKPLRIGGVFRKGNSLRFPCSDKWMDKWQLRHLSWLRSGDNTVRDLKQEKWSLQTNWCTMLKTPPATDIVPMLPLMSYLLYRFWNVMYEKYEQVKHQVVIAFPLLSAIRTPDRSAGFSIRSCSNRLSPLRRLWSSRGAFWWQHIRTKEERTMSDRTEA